MYLSLHEWVMAMSQGERGIAEGIHRRGPKRVRMRFAGVDISSELQIQSLHAPRRVPCCSDCKRRLLPGETLHVYENGSLCTLCAGARGEEPVRRERIRATASRLAVVPRAA